MRVIAGSKRRILLETPVGLNTRPTQDRIKETLFNMIGPDVYDCYFLDLFAGSGQMGIEALSRGAKEAVFIDMSPEAIRAITNNISKTKLEEQSTIYKGDVLTILKKLDSHEAFGYVFMDPPYNNDIEKEVLESLSTNNCIDDDTVIIVEASLETDFSYLTGIGFTIIKEKTYKTNKHLFIQKA